MSAGYTPGPWGWVIHDHSLASLGVLPNPGYGDPLVLAVGPCEECAERGKPDWLWGRCQTPSEANARLIAAAPQLYEALRDALDMIVDASRDGTYSLSEFEHLKAALKQARGDLVDPSEQVEL